MIKNNRVPNIESSSEFDGAFDGSQILRIIAIFKKVLQVWFLKHDTEEEKRCVIVPQYKSTSKNVSSVAPILCLLLFLNFANVLFAQVNDEPLAPHYIQTTVNNVNGTGEKVVTRDYIDGFGRNAQSQKRINHSEQGFSSVVTGIEYDEQNRPKKVVKPFAFSNQDDPLEFIPKTLSTDPECAINYYNGTSGRANAEGYPFSEIEYNDDPMGMGKMVGSPGMAYSIQSDPTIGHPVKTWYFGVTGDQTPINTYTFFDNDGFILPAYLSEGGLNDYLNDIIPQELTTTTVDLLYYLRVNRDGNGSFSQILSDKFGKTLRTWVLHCDGHEPVVSHYTYDDLGRITVETPPATPGKVSVEPAHFTYNALSQLISWSTPDAGTINYEYDNAGRLQELVDQKLFDSKFNQPDGYGGTETIEPRLRYEYDELGRIVTISRYEPSISPNQTKWCTWIRYIYDDPQSASQFLSTSAFPQGTELDGLLTGCSHTRGRLVASISYDSKFYTYRTDASKIAFTEGMYENKIIDLYSYDDEGRVNRKYKSIPGIDLQIKKYGYDLHGKVIADTIEFGDPVTRIITRYSYNEEGRPVNIYRNDKHYQTITYDDLGRIVKTTFMPGTPDSRSVEYSYTINELTKKIEASNNTFSEELCYETNDITDTLRTGLSYSPQYNGKVSRAKILTGTTGLGNDLDLLYYYDKADRLVQVANNKSYAQSSDFDATFTYHNDGRFAEKHEGPNQANWEEYTYHDKENTSYATNRIKSIPGSGKGDTTNANFIYDPNGNMVLDRAKKMAVEYDWRDMPVNFYMFAHEIDVSIDTWEEVTTLYEGGWTRNVAMTYDASGNRVKKETFEAPSPVGTQSLLINSLNNTTTLEVHTNGTISSNRVQSNFSQSTPDGALLSQNNSDYRLALSDLALQFSGTIVDENGMTVENGDLTTIFMGNDPPQLGINARGNGLALSGSLESRSLVSGVAYVDGSHVFVKNSADALYDLSYVNFSDGISRSDNTFEYHVKDHLGSIRVVLSEDGQIKESSAYLAYGQEKEIKTAPVNTRQKYSGRELDQDGIAYDNNNNQLTNGIGLNCFGARYYDPEIGSWTSTDPADEFWNSYSYVGGDPINFTDPSGMISIPAKPVSMFTSGIGRFAGTASIAGAFDYYTPVGSVDGLHFLNGMIRGKSDTTFYMGDAYVHGYREILDNDEEKEKEKGKGSSPGEDSPDKDNERNKWYWRDWADLREDIGPPENPMNDIRLRNSQLILRNQNLNIRDAIKRETPVASSQEMQPWYMQDGYTPEQQGLQDIVNDISNGGRTPIRPEDAEAIIELGKGSEYPGIRAGPSDVQGDHWIGPHIHVPNTGRGGHVPVQPGVKPITPEQASQMAKIGAIGTMGVILIRLAPLLLVF